MSRWGKANSPLKIYNEQPWLDMSQTFYESLAYTTLSSPAETFKILKYHTKQLAKQYKKQSEQKI